MRADILLIYTHKYTVSSRKSRNYLSQHYLIWLAFVAIYFTEDGINPPRPTQERTMMESHPYVAVGIVTYNHEAFLAECLDSVLAQTYPNFDIVIADDCSTDRTYDIALAYQAKYPDKIKKVLRPEKNTGISANVNRMLAERNAEYILSFAGDDVMLPGKIERQMALMLANPDASMCYTNLEWFDSDSGKKICTHYGLLQQPSEKLVDILGDNCVATNTMLWRRACAPAEGYDETLPTINDLDFVLKLCQRGRPIFTREVLARYRRHGNNLTATRFFTEERFMYLERLRKAYPQAEYAAALRKFEAIAYYALIRERIAEGKRGEAIRLLPRIFPWCFGSIKWLARCGIIAKSFVKGRATY